MPNITTTKLPDYRSNLRGENRWYSDNITSKYLVGGGMGPAYRIDAAGSGVTFSSASITVNFSGFYRAIQVKCFIYNEDPVVFTGLSPDPITSLTYTVTQNGSHTFSFSGLNAVGNSLFFTIETTDAANTIYESVTDPVSMTYALPDLTVSVSPATVYDISSAVSGYTNNVDLNFGSSRFDQQLGIVFKYNSTVLRSLYVSADFVRVNCSGWFDASGASGTNIRVSIEVTDGLGRTNTSAYFTLVKPQASTATATAPKNTTLDGTESANFAWSVSSDWGAQTLAELQWSTDNAVWSDLATVNGSTKAWTSQALRFPAGTIYWHVRVKNVFGLVGNWSSSVSFTVRYDAVSQVVPANSPTSGIINVAGTRVWQVALEASGAVYTPFAVASATYYWRQGTSGAWTALSMTPDGSSAAVTIAGGTMSSGPIQWYAEATDNTGLTTQTSVYTLTAMTAEVEAVPVSPINTVESTNGPILLRWDYGSIDGSTQAAAEIEYGTDGSSWGDPVSVSGSGTSWEAPSGTFSAGLVYWRVRSKNSANVWGPWSAAVSFQAFGSPVVRGVTANGKPFCTISWQVEGQRAYEIDIDGNRYGPYFGPDARSYITRIPLMDGNHTIRVRSQNRYGLWSEWTEGTASISNVPGPAFTIVAAVSGANVQINMVGATIAPIITKQPQDYQGQLATAFFRAFHKTWSKWFPASANISFSWEYRTSENAAWQAYTGTINAAGAISPPISQSIDGYQYRVKLSNAVGAIYSEPATFYYRNPRGYASVLKQGEWKADTGYFLVMRDGKIIGKTYNNEFVDRCALGSHSYQVVQVLPDGYYTAATAHSAATVAVGSPVIAALSGGDWIELRLSENPRREQSLSSGRQTASVYYAGAEYPDAEIGPQKSLSASGDAAWTYADKETADALEALIGKAVIYKTPGGALIVGVLSALKRTDKHFYRAYTFQISQMHWRDFVDES